VVEAFELVSKSSNSISNKGLKNKSCLYSKPVPKVKFETVFLYPAVSKKSLSVLDKFNLRSLSEYL
tara:strand:+ start:59 stop:256 length:198 start_codon:yes stop_codon:yes gene_type:complete